MANPAPGFKKHPEHAISIEHLGEPVTVRFAGAVVAQSEKALLLHEGSYPPVVYIPLKDVLPEHLERTSTHTHCPFKGDASYWTLSANGEQATDAMWAYLAPYDETMEIKDHAAFYPDKVKIEIG